MGSLLRTAKKHKKSRRLGKPEVMAREEYGELEVDVKIEMIRSLIPLGLMHVHELLDDEVKELAGERYARKNSSQRQRWRATALVDIEPSLRRVIGYRHLPKLREALKRELKIETKTSTVSKKKAA